MTIEPLLADLHAATDEFLSTLNDLTPAQWTWKPGPAIWSLQEVAEHTCVVQKGVERLFTRQLLDQPLTSETAAPRWQDSDLPRLLGDGAAPVRAPEMVHPKGRWTTREQIAATLTGSTEKVIGWARNTHVDLRAYGSTHPLLGMLDGVQWLIFIAAHTRHHARQVHRVRSLTGFP